MDAGEFPPKPICLLQVPEFASWSCQEKSPRTDVGSSCLCRRGLEIRAGTSHLVVCKRPLRGVKVRVAFISGLSQETQVSPKWETPGLVTWLQNPARPWMWRLDCKLSSTDKFRTFLSKCWDLHQHSEDRTGPLPVNAVVIGRKCAGAGKVGGFRKIKAPEICATVNLRFLKERHLYL